ncbi:hypothetical protein ACETK8_15860 [Brevundimonas staleyi]|uniref:Uncharacterized protein n=1 Tax=Brevundimonas staleyi TaxID=74326 RepID=A0ABW0FXB8_9CAUL
MMSVPRAWVELIVQAGIDLLDAADAGTEDLEPEDGEPDGEDEIVSEDDGLVRHWTDRVGRQG